MTFSLLADKANPPAELGYLLKEPPRENCANALQILRSLTPHDADDGIAMRQAELRLRALLQQLDGSHA